MMRFVHLASICRLNMSFRYQDTITDGLCTLGQHSHTGHELLHSAITRAAFFNLTRIRALLVDGCQFHLMCGAAGSWLYNQGH